jgi:molybdopterin/thiamine biosynthesis adenylyltransferase
MIGCGSVGHRAAKMMAGNEVSKMFLVDPDQVAVENLTTQDFPPSALEQPKVEAAAAECYRHTDKVEIETLESKFRADDFLEMVNFAETNDKDIVVFCCVDSIEARKYIFEAIAKSGGAKLWIDIRIANGSAVELYGEENPVEDGFYASTIHEPEESFEAACTSKMTAHMAGIAAGFMVDWWTRWLNPSLPATGGFLYNSITQELEVIEPDVEGDS